MKRACSFSIAQQLKGLMILSEGDHPQDSPTRFAIEYLMTYCSLAAACSNGQDGNLGFIRGSSSILATLGVHSLKPGLGDLGAEMQMALA